MSYNRFSKCRGKYPALIFSLIWTNLESHGNLNPYGWHQPLFTPLRIPQRTTYLYTILIYSALNFKPSIIVTINHFTTYFWFAEYIVKFCLVFPINYAVILPSQIKWYFFVNKKWKYVINVSHSGWRSFPCVGFALAQLFGKNVYWSVFCRCSE